MRGKPGRIRPLWRGGQDRSISQSRCGQRSRAAAAFSHNSASCCGRPILPSAKTAPMHPRHMGIRSKLSVKYISADSITQTAISKSAAVAVSRCRHSAGLIHSRSRQLGAQDKQTSGRLGAIISCHYIPNHSYYSIKQLSNSVNLFQ